MNWRELLFKTDLFAPFRWRRTKEDPYAPPWPGPRSIRTGRWMRDLLSVMSQLEAIVRANASLVRGLEHAALDAPRSSIELILLGIRDDLANGFSLSESMERRYAFFPRFYVDFVRMGEKSGRLGEALREAAEVTAERIERSNRVKHVMQYLWLVILVSSLIVVFVLTYIFPELRVMFNDFESLPPMTGLAGVLNRVVTTQWPTTPNTFQYSFGVVLMGIVLVGMFAFGRRLFGRRTGFGRALSEAQGLIVSTLPGFRQVLVKRNVGYSARVLERLLEAGVPIDDALADVAELDMNGLYSERWYRIHRNVVMGSTLTEAIDAERGFPRGFRDMVRVGEQSGRLPEALGRIGALYERQAQRTSKVLTDTIFPAAILVLGAIVFLLYGAVFSVTVQLTEAFLHEL